MQVLSGDNNRGKGLPAEFFELAQIGIDFLFPIELCVIISA